MDDRQLYVTSLGFFFLIPTILAFPEIKLYRAKFEKDKCKNYFFDTGLVRDSFFLCQRPLAALINVSNGELD